MTQAIIIIAYNKTTHVTPAEAGVHFPTDGWIPASAGMTKLILEIVLTVNI